MVKSENEQLESRLRRLEQPRAPEAGTVTFRRALSAGPASSPVESLNDLLSSLRIEVMAAEGELEQYASTTPRENFERMLQALRESMRYCDEARELRRKLAEPAGTAT